MNRHRKMFDSAFDFDSLFDDGIFEGFDSIGGGESKDGSVGTIVEECTFIFKLFLIDHFLNGVLYQIN